MYEYDFLQRRLLNRRQALDKREFRKTIKILKKQPRPRDNIQQKTKHITEHIEDNYVEQSLWKKIKYFFTGR